VEDQEAKKKEKKLWKKNQKEKS